MTPCMTDFCDRPKRPGSVGNASMAVVHIAVYSPQGRGSSQLVRKA